MDKIIFIITLFLLSGGLYSQKKIDEKSSFFRPSPPKENIHPTLDTSGVLYADTIDVFFERKFSEDLDESGVSLSKKEEQLRNLQNGNTNDESDESDHDVIDLTDEDEHEHEDEDEVDSLANNIFGIIIPNEAEWVKIDTFFRSFNPYAVNSYHYNPENIKDTLTFKLFENGRKWSMPMTASHYITSPYGPRGGRMHYGTDLKLSIGDTIMTCFDGIVRISKYNPGGYGNYVLVRHYNGTETIYGHLNERLVTVGQEVKAGQIIGYGGNTGRSSGPHLHFEVRYRGLPMNPQRFFNFQQQKVVSAVVKIEPSNFKKVVVQSKKVYHKVKKGETLYSIAKKYRVSVSQICKYNKLTTRSTLKYGRTLRIK